MRLPWLLVLAFVLAPVNAVRADGPYEGSWRPGPMRIEVGVQSWGSDCPPQPRSTTTPGGGPVRVTQSGDHLTFPDGHTTRDCWSANPAVRRVSSTYSDGTWRIVCRSPSDDSRQETGTYTLRASTLDRLEFRDVTDYDWSLNESHCTARITTTQTFERIGTATPTPETPVVPVETVAPACTPGAPARIAMRPSTTTIGPGERACITARVVDANGCPTAGAAPTFELRSPAGQSGELRGGCFTAGPTTAGSFVLTARSGALSADATIQVRVLDLSDLIARRTEAGGVAGEPTATTGSDARVAARSESARPGMPLWAALASIAGLILVLVAVVGLLTRGKRRRTPRREDVPFGSPIASTDAAPPGASSAAPVASSSPVSEQASASDAMICPVCRRGYGANVTLCPKDKEQLVPYATFVQRRAESAPSKVCPKCGTTYAGNVKFCGKDGTTL